MHLCTLKTLDLKGPFFSFGGSFKQSRKPGLEWP
jgi:hypothetical protein